MLYVLLLSIYSETSPMDQVSVEDYALTGSDCIAALEAYSSADPMWSRGIPSCEPDHSALPAIFTHNGDILELPACEQEDSKNCYWDATIRGNGLGNSFYDVNGKTFLFFP